MTTNVTETLLLGVGITVLVVVLLRLLAASYWLWRDDQSEKRRLQSLLDRPYQRQIEAAGEYTMQLRVEMSETFARLLAVVEVFHLPQDAPLLKDGLILDYVNDSRRARELINALSYDAPLRVVSHNFLVLAAMIQDAQARKVNCDELWEKMQSLKKVVFRLLHKQDGGSMGEIISMLEAQNIVESHDLLSNDDSDSFDVVVRQLQEAIKNPDIYNRLRKKIESGAFDRSNPSNDKSASELTTR